MYSFRKSRCMVRENSEMAKIWPFLAKIWPFLAKKWQFWKFLVYNFQRLLWNFLIFGMKIVLKLFFEKIILYMPRKFWDDQNLAICGQNLSIFDQNWQFFQPKLFWLSGEPIILWSCFAHKSFFGLMKYIYWVRVRKNSFLRWSGFHHRYVSTTYQI